MAFLLLKLNPARGRGNDVCLRYHGPGFIRKGKATQFLKKSLEVSLITCLKLIAMVTQPERLGPQGRLEDYRKEQDRHFEGMDQYFDIFNQDFDDWSQRVTEGWRYKHSEAKNVQVNKIAVLRPCLNSRHAPEMRTSSRRDPEVMSTYLMSDRGVCTHLLDYGIGLYDWGGRDCSVVALPHFSNRQSISGLILLTITNFETY